MTLLHHSRQLSTNRILAALSADEYERLTFGAERVRLVSGKILFDAGDEIRHAYFPLSGIASLVSVTEDGKSVEVAAVGREGMVGIPVVLKASNSPYRVTAQLAGGAIRVRATTLRAEFERGGHIRDLLFRHALGLLTQLSQSVACHRFHTVQQRLACWLLMTRDRAGSESFHITQEFLSYMLGVPRTSVTAFAATMQRDGLISYSRGSIVLLDVRGLEATSCVCYRIIAREISRLIAA